MWIPVLGSELSLGKQGRCWILLGLMFAVGVCPKGIHAQQWVTFVRINATFEPTED